MGYVRVLKTNKESLVSRAYCITAEPCLESPQLTFAHCRSGKVGRDDSQLKQSEVYLTNLTCRSPAHSTIPGGGCRKQHKLYWPA